MELFFWRLARVLLRLRLHKLAHLATLTGRLLYGSYIPGTVEIGSGTHIAYGGAGVVINKDARIGSNCLISPGVLLGSGPGKTLKFGAPVIEDDVRIYQNAVILGGVRIGRGAVVGANAVVIEDVPPNARAVAPKARVVQPPATAPGRFTE
jgi:serine O-acetyltransferase